MIALDQKPQKDFQSHLFYSYSVCLMSYIHNSYSLDINRTSVLGSFHQHAPFLLKTWGFSHDLSHSDGLWIQGSVGADLLIHLCC